MRKRKEERVDGKLEKKRGISDFTFLTVILQKFFHLIDVNVLMILYLEHI